MFMEKSKASLRQRIETRIARKRNDAVFLTRELQNLGGEDQVRALRQLVRGGRLVKLGYGVYGRAIASSLTGHPILYRTNGFDGAAREALTKLGVAWELGRDERTYQEGRSNQIASNTVLKVKGRFSRKLSFGNAELIIEN